MQTFFQQRTLESWYTNLQLEQMPLNRRQQLPAPYKMAFIHDVSKTEKWTSNILIWLTNSRANLTNNRWIETNQWIINDDNFTQVLQVIPSWLNWPITFSGVLSYNSINWQTLFTWLRRWLLLRLSKCQSPTTVQFFSNLPSWSHNMNVKEHFVKQMLRYFFLSALYIITKQTCWINLICMTVKSERSYVAPGLLIHKKITVARLACLCLYMHGRPPGWY